MPGDRGQPQANSRGPLPGSDLAANALKPAGGGLDRVDRQPERGAQDVLEMRRSLFRATVAHASRSRTERSEDMAREVWLLTAPLVMPMAAAI